MFTVEKDVPISGEYAGRGRPMIYPFRDMEPGDSFEFSGSITERKRVAAAARKWGKANGKGFSIKRIGDDNYRCWRIA